MSEPGPKRSRMRKARKYALDILYSADMTGASVADTIARYATMSDHEIPAYSRELAQGVASHDYLIDGYLAPSLAGDWTVERMPVVDRCLARLAVYEMVFADVPPAIAISEAVGLAKELSTDASATFLTGALGHVATLIAPSDEETAPTVDSDPVEGASHTDEVADPVEPVEAPCDDWAADAPSVDGTPAELGTEER